MEIEEFERRAKSIVEVELKKITTMVKKIPDNNAKEQANMLGLSTIDDDIKSNPLAFNVLKNFIVRNDTVVHKIIVNALDKIRRSCHRDFSIELKFKST